MKLHEEFKLFENMWEDDEVKENTLTEARYYDIDLGIKMSVQFMKLTHKLYPKGAEEIMSIILEDTLDFDTTGAAPLYLTKEKVIGMMFADLSKLSTKKWIDKWLAGFVNEGILEINPADYPEIHFPDTTGYNDD